MPSRIITISVIAICMCFCAGVSGQSVSLSDKLLRITSKSDSINSLMPAEKVFMQLDKPYYAPNDTLWFKAYILNSSYLTPSAKSGFLYVDVADKAGVLVKQLRFAAPLGLSWGNIPLNEKDFKPGAYLIRAYTTWMRNFGEENFLYISFAVVDSAGRVPPPLAYKSIKAKGEKTSRVAQYAMDKGINLSASPAADSVLLTITAADSVVQKKQTYFLITKARGVVCYAAVVNLNVRQFQKKLPLSIFPSGTAYFSLLDTTGRQVLVSTLAVDHHDSLNVNIGSDKPQYGPRDSVALQLNISDANGKPLTGNFSVSVTDDAQVKNEVPPAGNLAGLTTNTLNNGSSIMPGPAQPKFPAETEFTIPGLVVNGFNRPAAKATVTLLSRKPSVLSEALTGDDGRFIFKNIPLSDTAIFVLQAKNKRGRMFNVDVRVNELAPPPFNKASIVEVSPTAMPLADTMAVTMAKKQQEYKQYTDKLIGVDHNLKEVKIVAKKIVKGSKNWNGGGNADVVFDEKELERAGKKTFLDLLTERVPGFREGAIIPSRVWPDDVIEFDDDIKGTHYPSPWYYIQDKVALLFVDGVEVRGFIKPFTFKEYRNYLLDNTAEDVNAIEVSISSKYTGAYLQRWKSLNNDITYRDFAFIEITTRSGSGPGIRHGIGSYLYKPLAIAYPGVFNSPRYTAGKTAKDAPDIRSTLFWSPNFLTDTDGKATVSFFTGDGPATYTVTIAGTDMNGNIGSATYKLKVRQ